MQPDVVACFGQFQHDGTPDAPCPPGNQRSSLRAFVPLCLCAWSRFHSSSENSLGLCIDHTSLERVGGTPRFKRLCRYRRLDRTRTNVAARKTTTRRIPPINMVGAMRTTFSVASPASADLPTTSGLA